MSKPKRLRPGRPPLSDDEVRTSASNRERILDVARGEFAAKGFRATTLRSIAALVGVDVALIPHYYRNKEGLFAAPLEFPPGTAGLVAQALTGPSGTQAERLTRAYLGLWEDDATGRQLRSLARSAFGDERARLSVEEALLGTVPDPATSLVLDGRRIGFVLAMAQLLGVALQRHLLPGSPTSTLDLEALIARVAHAIAVHLATADP